MSSRVARNPVVLPAGVEVTVGAGELSVKGPLGTLQQAVSADVKVEKIENRLEFAAVGASIHAKAMSGTLRALAANMVQGVSKGFERRLNLVGVGYRAQAQGDKLNLTLGFSHPVVHAMPKGIKVETPTQTEIVIKGIDKQQVGEVAAQVRAYRRPEPYKGKGVRYSDEVIVLKETKKK
jgi:large subunit ribosomal protein L6